MEWTQQIKDKVKNYQLFISTEVKQLQRENFILSKEEIYKKMVEINPIVERLRQELELDIYG